MVGATRINTATEKPYCLLTVIPLIVVTDLVLSNCT